MMRNVVTTSSVLLFFCWITARSSAFVVVPSPATETVRADTSLNFFGNALKGAFENSDTGPKQNAGLSGVSINKCTNVVCYFVCSFVRSCGVFLSRLVLSRLVLSCPIQTSICTRMIIGWCLHCLLSSFHLSCLSPDAMIHFITLQNTIQYRDQWPPRSPSMARRSRRLPTRRSASLPRPPG